LAFLAACLVAAIILSLTISLQVAMAAPSTGFDTQQFSGLLKSLPQMVGYMMLPIIVLAAIPALAVIGLAGVYRIRSFWFYVAAGAAVALVGVLISRLGLSFAITPTNSKFVKSAPSIIPKLSSIWNFLLAGLAAGAMYWAIAGRRASTVRDQPPLKSTTDVG
jgi:hypothetical protein